MKSIRRQLMLGLLTGLLFLFAVCGAMLYIYVRHALLSQFDESLLDKVRAFAAMSEQDGENDDEENNDEDNEEEDEENDDEDNDNEDEKGERSQRLHELPTAVQEAIEKHTGGGLVTEIERENRNGTLVYEIKVLRNGEKVEFKVSTSGEYLGSEDEFEFEFSEAALPEFQPSPNAEYYQVWDEDGKIVARSPSLEGRNLKRIRALLNKPRILNIVLPDGRPGRAVALMFNPRHGNRKSNNRGIEHTRRSREYSTLTMARSRADLDRALGILLSGLLLTGVLLLASVLLLVHYTINKGLHPLSTMANEAATIDAGSLTHRFPTSSVPQEILPISIRLNGLLERLEAAFQREQRFTSDAAHELRTPIAELHLLAEIGLKSATTLTQDEELNQYFQDALDIANQMERLATTLLTLARCESGLQDVNLQNVELISIIEKAWKHFKEKAYRRKLTVEFHLPEEAFLATDSALLTAILRNLFANAVAYTPDAGKIMIDIKNEGNMLLVILSNTNNQLKQQDLEHLFEAFWRKDKARSSSSHCGVGLSVASSFARLLGIELTVDLPSESVFQISLAIPRQEA